MRDATLAAGDLRPSTRRETFQFPLAIRLRLSPRLAGRLRFGARWPDRRALGVGDLLVDRARLLGRGVALARDVFNPDRVVLLGQAFSGYRPGLTHLAASFAAASVLEPLNPRVSSLGPRVQALAACTAALRRVYPDPLGTVRKAEAREHTC